MKAKRYFGRWDSIIDLIPSCQTIESMISLSTKYEFEHFYVYFGDFLRKANIQCSPVRRTPCSIDIIYIAFCTLCHLPCDTDIIPLAFVAFALYKGYIIAWYTIESLWTVTALCSNVDHGKLRSSNIIGQAAVSVICQNITNVSANTSLKNKRGIHLTNFIFSIMIWYLQVFPLQMALLK